MKNKRQNPYTALLEEIKEWFHKFKYRHTTQMAFYPVEKLKPETGWRLDSVYERVIAAKSLGYEVVIEADEKGMEIKYKKIVSVPWHFEN